jgi:RsiW-degrading membrane proteinase PrsW (M82 family)
MAHWSWFNLRVYLQRFSKLHVRRLFKKQLYSLIAFFFNFAESSWNLKAIVNFEVFREVYLIKLCYILSFSNILKKLYASWCSKTLSLMVIIVSFFNSNFWISSSLIFSTFLFQEVKKMAFWNLTEIVLFYIYMNEISKNRKITHVESKQESQSLPHLLKLWFYK